MTIGVKRRCEWGDVSWTTWWLFAVTETVLSLTPGPAVLFVLSSALRARRQKERGLNPGDSYRQHGLFRVVGHGARRTADYVLPCILPGEVDRRGISRVFQALVQFWGIARFSRPGNRQKAGASAARLYRDGFVLQMSNPKAIIFFSALAAVYRPAPRCTSADRHSGPNLGDLRVCGAVELQLGGSPRLHAGPATALRQMDQPHRWEFADWRGSGAGRIAAGLIPTRDDLWRSSTLGCSPARWDSCRCNRRSNNRGC